MQNEMDDEMKRRLNADINTVDKTLFQMKKVQLSVREEKIVDDNSGGNAGGGTQYLYVCSCRSHQPYGWHFFLFLWNCLYSASDSGILMRSFLERSLAFTSKSG